MLALGLNGVTKNKINLIKDSVKTHKNSAIQIKYITQIVEGYPDMENKRVSKYKNQDDIALIAYCFSAYETTSVYPNLKQGEAFKVAATVLEMNPNTLTRARSSMDNLTLTGIRKVCGNPPSKYLQDAYQLHNTKSKDEIIALAKKILKITT